MLGKLLLIKGLKGFNIDYQILQDLQVNDNDRPFLPNVDIEFNISHSGRYVLCAICKQLRVGIDIEEKKRISFDVFKNVMTPEQLEIIYSTPDPLKMFYRYWAIKESVIKADGRGLKIPLDKLEIDNNIIVYDSKSWYITEFTIDDWYASAFATNELSEYSINWVDFYTVNELIK